MDRRSFLTLAGAGVAGALVAPTIAAAADPNEERRLLERLAAARRRWERASARTLARVGRSAEEASEGERAWARGVGAMVAIESLSRVKVENQAHPVAQALLRELFEGVGAGIRSLRSILKQVGDGPEPERGALDPLFDGESRALDQETGLGETSRRLNRNGLANLRAEIADEGLTPRARREARRLERLEGLAARIADAGGESAVLTPADPEFALAADRGRAKWSAVEKRESTPYKGLLYLGLIACGLGVLAAGYLFVVTAVCAVACEAPGLLLLTLLAGVIIAALVAGIIYIVRALRDKPDAAPRDAPPGEIDPR